MTYASHNFETLVIELNHLHVPQYQQLSTMFIMTSLEIEIKSNQKSVLRHRKCSMILQFFSVPYSNRQMTLTILEIHYTLHPITIAYYLDHTDSVIRKLSSVKQFLCLNLKSIVICNF